MSKSVILVGGPDTGKTNFLARLVAQLRDGKGELRATHLPDDMRYVEEALAFLMKGEFAPRSHNNAEELSGEIVLDVSFEGENSIARVVLPDVAGETWDEVVRSGQISQSWLDRVRSASGALLFVRVLSELNVQPLDWVGAPKLFAFAGEHIEHIFQIPTQVVLCELLRLLDENLSRTDNNLRRVAVIITAYDRLDSEKRAAGPKAFLEKEFPLFAGKIANMKSLEVGIFGSSVVGGELTDVEFRNAYLDSDIVESGYIIDNTDTRSVQVMDISQPISWVLGYSSSS